MQDIHKIMSTPTFTQQALLGEILDWRKNLEKQIVEALIQENETVRVGLAGQRSPIWSYLDGIYTATIHIDNHSEPLFDSILRQVERRLKDQPQVIVLDPFAGLGGTLCKIAEIFPTQCEQGRLQLIAWNLALNAKELISKPTGSFVTEQHLNYIAYPTGRLEDLLAYTIPNGTSLVDNVDIIIERMGLVHTLIPDVWMYCLGILLKSTGIAYLHTINPNQLEQKNIAGENDTDFRCRQKAFSLGQGNLTIKGRQLIFGGPVDIYASSEHLV